ncbi:MAG: hypothetical protein M5U34_40900 [Chloroflexi bacterium]|nr:hypothetical protein [Chloroflexota bacterium]
MLFYAAAAPTCGEGQDFRGLWRMNEDCPVCGVHFEREQGYWMMSIFIGYVIYGVILAPAALILYFQQVPGVTPAPDFRRADAAVSAASFPLCSGHLAAHRRTVRPAQE